MPLWQLKLRGPRVAIPRSAVDPTAEANTTRLVKDLEGEWTFSTGISQEYDDRPCLCVLVPGNGLVTFRTLVKDTYLTAGFGFFEDEDKAASREQLITPSTESSDTTLYLRPDDTIDFKSHEVSFTLAAASLNDFEAEAPKPLVEVKSSGAIDAAVEETESDNEGDLDVKQQPPIPTQTSTALVYSTAQTAIQETPVAQRVIKMVDDDTVSNAVDNPDDSSPEPDEIPAFVRAQEAAESVCDPTREVSNAAIDKDESEEPRDHEGTAHDQQASDEDSTLLAVAKKSDKRRYGKQNGRVKVAAAETSNQPDIETPTKKRGRKRKTVEVYEDPNDDHHANMDPPPKKLRGSQPDKESPQAKSADSKSRKKSRTSIKAQAPNGSASPISGSPPDGQKCNVKHPIVVFSNSLLESKPSTKKWLTSQGAKIVGDVDKTANTFVCVGPGELKTTAKVLMALVCDHEVVSDEWVKQSQEAGYLLHPDGFRPKGLENTQQRSRTKMFSGQTFYFTPAAKRFYKAGFEVIVEILEAAGAKQTEIKAAREIPADADAVIIGLDSNDNDAKSLLQRDMTVHRREVISDSILQAELLVGDSEYQLARSKSPARGVKGKKK